MKKVWIAEVRRNWLSRYVIGTFETPAQAEKAIKAFQRENPHFLSEAHGDFYDVNWAVA